MGVTERLMSCRGLAAVVACALALAAPGLARAAVGDLTYDSCLGAGSTCTSLTGPLDNVDSVAVAPSGSIYTVGYDLVGFGTQSGVLGAFTPDAQGRPTFSTCFTDYSHSPCTTLPSSTLLEEPTNVATSPVNGSVYVGGQDYLVLNQFRANAQGTLEWVTCLSPSATGCVSTPGAESFGGMRSVAVSQDAGAPNSSVYYSGLGLLGHLFARPDDGQLNYDGCIVDSSGLGCTVVSPSPLGEADGVAVDPLDRDVYVPGFDGTVAQISTVSNGGGALRLPLTCINEDGSHGCRSAADGGALTEAATPVVGADGTSVYVPTNAGIVRLVTDPTNAAAPSFGGCIGNGPSNDVCTQSSPAVQYVDAVALSPDGATLYALSSEQKALSWFSVGSQGTLTFQGCVSSTVLFGCSNPAGLDLDDATAIAVSPNGASVYVTADDSLIHFVRTTTTAPLSGPGAPPGGGGTGTGGTGTPPAGGGTGTGGTGAPPPGGTGTGGSATGHSGAGHRIAAPQFTLLKNLTVSRKGTFTLAVTCAAGGSACAGTVTVTVPAAGHSAHTARKPRSRTIALTHFRVPAGRRGRVTLHLNHLGRSLLSPHHALRAGISVLARDGSAVRRASRTVQLRLAKH